MALNLDFINDIAKNGTDEQVNEQLRQMVDTDRRVISRNETIAYMFFNGSQGLNIDGHKDLFNDSVLKLDLDFQSKYNVVAGVWDIVDDLIVTNVIEKTRTRWGKFIPYIFVGGFPFALFATLYWLLPLFFSTAHVDDFTFLPKLLIFAVLDMMQEFLGNFKNVAIGGYMSTITPFPSDRRRLRSVASYFNIIYSRLPDLVIEFTLDFIKNGVVKSAAGNEAKMIRRALMIMGPATSMVSGIIITWYASIAKERVHQRVEVPKLRDSLRVVFTNKPVLMYMFSNALGSFGTGLSTNDYYRQVLNMTTFETIAGIPSFFFQPIGFSQFTKMTEKYSTRNLYMISQVFAKAFYIPLWFYGRFLKTKDGKFFFQGRIPMLPVTAVWECIYATWWGIKCNSADEIGAECNDYIEWKCGYRNEATLSMASTFICKIPGRLNGILQPKYKKWIHYDQTAYTENREQPLGAQKWIFAMSTLIPAILVLSSMIPMFWYDIDKTKRDRMYVELNERRVKTAELVNAAAKAESEE